jgi:aminoglycoside phosphotransferase (APT) family kinase protein
MEKIGEGGEAEVFALDDTRVLRRWRKDHSSIAARIPFTREVAAGAGHLDFAVPEILDHHMDDEGRPCFVERRLPGRSMTEALAEVTGAQRESLLTSYLDTAVALRSIAFDRPWFGEILPDAPLRSGRWVDYLGAALERQMAAADPAAYPEVDLGSVSASLRDELADVPEPTPSLLHFDYFPGNVLCDDSQITAVIDWSVLSIVGDPDLDVALAIDYFAVTPTADADDVAFARDWLRDQDLGGPTSFYERWGAAWWLPLSDDENIRSFVAGVLER